MVMVAATAPMASTKRPCTRSLRLSGLSVRLPSVRAAAATLSAVGMTRTKNSTFTSTRIRFWVISDFSPARRTSIRSVFMLTSVTSCTIGKTNAPPPMTTFSPPRPVRTKERSFDE